MPPKTADDEAVEETEDAKSEDGADLTPDSFISKVIRMAYVKTLEINMLDYETHQSGAEPQHVHIHVEMQDPNKEEHEVEEFDGSGSYMGEALVSCYEQVEARFGEPK